MRKSSALPKKEESRRFFELTMASLKQVVEISAKNANSTKWRGPDCSAVSLDEAVITANIDKCIKRRDSYALFAYGVLCGRAAQYRFQKIVENGLRERQRPLSKGRFATYGSQEAQIACHGEWWTLYGQAKRLAPKSSHNACCHFVQAHTQFRNSITKRPFTVRNISAAIREMQRTKNGSAVETSRT